MKIEQPLSNKAIPVTVTGLQMIVDIFGDLTQAAFVLRSMQAMKRPICYYDLNSYVLTKEKE